MWIVSWDPFLIKKLIKSDICGSVNSARMHYSRLKKLAFTAESKKTWNAFCAQTWTQNARLNCNYSGVCVSTLRFSLFFGSARNSWLCQLWTVHPCTVQESHKLLFNKFFIKNGSYSAIYIFKNYFITVFSVFSSSKNKFNPNIP